MELARDPMFDPLPGDILYTTMVVKMYDASPLARERISSGLLPPIGDRDSTCDELVEHSTPCLVLDIFTVHMVKHHADESAIDRERRIKRYMMTFREGSSVRREVQDVYPWCLLAVNSVVSPGRVLFGWLPLVWLCDDPRYVVDPFEGTNQPQQRHYSFELRDADRRREGGSP